MLNASNVVSMFSNEPKPVNQNGKDMRPVMEPMMTQREAAEYIAQMLRVSVRTVYERWVHFPGFPIPTLLPTMGKVPHKRYDRAEIAAWVERIRSTT